MTLKPKKMTLNDAIADIERDFGAGSIMLLGSQPQKVEVIPTGSERLDVALGIGGLPRGRICELYGPEGAAKSTLAQHIVAQAQKQSLTTAYIDVEQTLDPEYARKIGVDIDKLVLSQPTCAEEALEIAVRLARNGVGLIVIDSVAALVPRAELAGEMGEVTVGLQARLMGQAIRKLVPAAAKTQTTVLFINQLREAIGVMFGSPERQPGGKALKFAATIRMDIRRIESLKHGDTVFGQRVRVKTIKNKLASPLQLAEFNIRYGQGIDQAQEQLEIGLENGSVKRSGAWFTIDGQRYQGTEAARCAL